MAKNIFPPALKPGGTIGIVAPARWLKSEGIKKTKVFLEKRGYRVVVHPQNDLRDGQLAGTDADRVSGLMDMFANPKIDAILCARGGGNGIRIIDKLDYKVIKRNPKPFIGFSDITVFLNAITKQCGFVTYHGPMAWNFVFDFDLRTVEDCFAILANTKKNFKHTFSGVDVLRPGKAEGVLIGGNITRLELLMDTAYDWSAKGGILFLEDVDEVLYKLDEKLQHLRLAGRFKDVRAIIIGEMINIGDGENGFVRKGKVPYGRTFKQIVLENMPPHIPLCMNFPCGHGEYLTTLPVGASVKLTLSKRGAELSFERT